MSALFLAPIILEYPKMMGIMCYDLNQPLGKPPVVDSDWVLLVYAPIGVD